MTHDPRESGEERVSRMVPALREPDGLALGAEPALLSYEVRSSGAENREGFLEEVRAGLGLEN